MRRKFLLCDRNLSFYEVCGGGVVGRGHISRDRFTIISYPGSVVLRWVHAYNPRALIRFVEFKDENFSSRKPTVSFVGIFDLKQMYKIMF